MTNNRILVVEDSKMINNVLKNKLGEFGYMVDQSFCISEAKNLIEKNEYMLIILDLHLPDGEGYELIDDIHDITNTKVIVLTSSNEEQLREELFRYGILDYIIKDKNFIYSIYEIHKTLQRMQMFSNRKILVIDDSSFIIKQIKTVLLPRNYILCTAKSGKEGLKLLENEEIDLIVLDMELPDMNGMDVLESIRKDMTYVNIPVIVLSGALTHDTIRKILKGGGSDFVKKPFVVEEFILKIDLLIENAQKEKSIQEKAKMLNRANTLLEEKVEKTVEELREKDIIMFQQSRLAQMGEMLSMIAHQWRQPLNAISSTATALKLKALMGKANEEMIIDSVDKISFYIKHLSSTIDDFRDFFKPKREKQETNLDILVESALLIVKSSLDDKRINVQKKLNSHSTFVSYANELKQVILNLIKNAEDALVEKKIHNPWIKIETYEKENELILDISDNAKGIPTDTIDKIFDPYFTTKTKKDGTGLGLYMSKIIVEDHCQGKLEVKNSDSGAVFSIKLRKDGE